MHLGQLKNSSEISRKEKDRLFFLLEQYAKTENGKFLNQIPYKRFRFFFCHSMNINNGVMGAYSIMKPFSIFFMKSYIDYMFSTIVHELRHAWQWRKFSILYTLCCAPIIRELTIEVDAKIVTENANDFISNFIPKEAEIKWNNR